MGISDIELDAYGIGDVPDYLAEEGLELAIRYFEENGLNAADCYEAFQKDKASELGKAWLEAEVKANQALSDDVLYGNSMIVLKLSGAG